MLYTVFLYFHRVRPHAQMLDHESTELFQFSTLFSDPPRLVRPDSTIFAARKVSRAERLTSRDVAEFKLAVIESIVSPGPRGDGQNGGRKES